MSLRVGIADHYGWAVAVTATDDYGVVDRRRIELIEPDTPTAPFEHDTKGLDDAAAGALIEEVRGSAMRATAAGLDELAAALTAPITAISLRAWPHDFPEDLTVLRRPPYDTRADGVMYRQVLADIASEAGWEVHLYDAKGVEAQATALLGARADDVLHGPRKRLGPPWATDHRVALAATIVSR